MAFNVTTDLGLCVPVTKDYVQLFGEENSPRGRKIKNTGFLSMLLDSTFNKSRMISDYITGVPGKRRGVKTLFKQPMCFTICATDFDCREERETYSSVLKVAELDVDTRYTPCKTVGQVTSPMEFKLTSQELATYCDIEDAEFVKEEIIDYDVEFVNQLDKTIFTIAEGYVKPANRLNRAIVIKNPLTAQYTLNAQWELMIDSALTDAGLNSDDSVIIGGLVVKMMQGMGANSKFKMYYDVNADAILGKYSFMIIPRGALQLVTWNDFVGSRRFISSDNLMEQSVKLVPLADGGSLNIDYFWKYDPACGEFAYMPQIYAELIKAVDGNCVSANQDGLFIFSNCTDDLIETCA